MSSSIKERPIILSSLMIQAILDGKKTQTRRVIKPQPLPGQEYHKTMDTSVYALLEMGGDLPVDRIKNVKCPYGQVGDRLWVRETWAVNPTMEEKSPRDISTVAFVYYKASSRGSPLLIGKWRPSIFMPRWASRITLEITGVRVERLQEISTIDIVNEGLESAICFGKNGWVSSVDWYHKLWDSLNAKRGYGWEANPWVWVIKFDNIGIRVK